LEEVQVLINKLDFKDSLTTDKFIQYDKSEITCEMISDEKIIKAIHSDNQKNQKKKIKTSLSQITYDEVIESYDKMILYLEQQGGNYDMRKEKLKFVKKLKKEALKQHFIFVKQVSINSFITTI